MAVTMTDIEKQTLNYARPKAELDALMAEIDAEREALQRKYLPRLRTIMNRISKEHAELYRMIIENPDLFSKPSPRSQMFEGITVGLQKGKGKLDIEDEDLTVLLIKQRMPDQKDVLIRTKEEPNKAAIKLLSDKDIQQIGARIIGKEDQVVIKDANSVVLKVLNSLLTVQVKELQAEYEEAA